MDDATDLLSQIADLAAEVRRLQCEYFRSRCREVLIASKVAERRLDVLLAIRRASQATQPPEAT